MNNDQHDFEQFIKQRNIAAGEYVNGNEAPLREIVTNNSPATFFAPRGGYREGAETVWSQYERDATNFESGESRFEILHMAANNGLAYWVGFQRATARLQGVANVVPFDLRITEIFRREGNTWKLIHRHADPLISEPENK